jgi:hypothetical protein
LRESHVLALVGLAGWAIAIWAQVGDSVVLSLSSAVYLAPQAQPAGQPDQDVLRLVALNTRIWNVIL